MKSERKDVGDRPLAWKNAQPSQTADQQSKAEQSAVESTNQSLRNWVGTKKSVNERGSSLWTQDNNLIRQNKYTIKVKQFREIAYASFYKSHKKIKKRLWGR